ncbi:MAG: GNAT family N-acetyltransferase [Desulfurococcaceae archaeon]
MDYDIKHTSTVIYAVMPDNSKAYIKYSVKDSVMELLETYTPPNWRGIGVARKLVEYAIDLARRNNWLIKPVCSYTISYFIRNPDKRYILIPEYRDKSTEELEKILEERLREEASKNK